MSQRNFSHCLTTTATAIFLAACASSNSHRLPPTPDTPPALSLSPAYHLVLAARASGVQIYQCSNDSDGPPPYEWKFKAPNANLVDFDGKALGQHYAGPTWEALDGSTVTGKLRASDPGPDAASVPWLTLDAKANAGAGLFSTITAIQRLHTHGGKAPAGGCTPEQLGTELRVPYTAEYYFYTGAP